MQLFFVRLIRRMALEAAKPDPIYRAEARVELADEVERRNLWLTNRRRTRKI